MNGAEHFREAERLLAESSNLLGDPVRAEKAGTTGWRGDIAHFLVARAQVHATLAEADAASGQTQALHLAAEETRRLRQTLQAQQRPPVQRVNGGGS